MNGVPKVSVIVPNYNHGRYLYQRLDSIFSQTFQDFEVIFLDDASTDDSLSVLERFASDPRLRVVVNQINSGSPFKQWNKGFELAEGEYIWIAESDDYADGRFLESLVGALDRNSKAGLAYCQSWVVGREPASAPIGLLEFPYAGFVDRNRWKSDFTNSGPEEIRSYLIYNNTIPNASAVVFRASLLIEGLTAPEDMRLAGDWMFWARILTKTDLIFLADPLNYFREAHSGSQRDKTKAFGLELIEGVDVYSCIASNLSLDAKTRKNVLLEQTKVWGTLACSRRLAWQTNRGVYSKLREAHAEVRARPVSAILLPFLVYYLSAPLRRTTWFSIIFRKFSQGSRSALDKCQRALGVKPSRHGDN
jgi:glycosyltransferase involved in cell wall biosynthesis